MSTRGIIAFGSPDEWAGRYHHFCASPEDLGRELWHLYRGDHFARDLDAMYQTLFVEHPAGWSNVIGCDWSLAPGFVEYTDAETYRRDRRPRCYCHGSRSEAPQSLSSEGPFAGTEWAYVIDRERRTMTILEAVGDDEKHAMGFFGLNLAHDHWRLCATVALDDGVELDWQAIEGEQVAPQGVEPLTDRSDKES